MRVSLARAGRGFTLLEVLVALAIFASVSAVVLTAAGRSLSNAGRLEELTLAGWIADNRISELQLQQVPPAIGRETRELEFGGRQWQTLSEVEASADRACCASPSGSRCRHRALAAARWPSARSPA